MYEANDFRLSERSPQVRRQARRPVRVSDLEDQSAVRAATRAKATASFVSGTLGRCRSSTPPLRMQAAGTAGTAGREARVV
jgi:hypothetical protein